MNRFLTLIFFCTYGTIYSQPSQKMESLDNFFAGIPLNQSYDKWVKYVLEDSTLGIDSAGTRGLYSSFKAARTNHFPFPDSIPVKLLLQTALTVGPSKRSPADTIRVVMIEGVFEDSEKGKENALAYVKVLTAILKPYYYSHNQKIYKTAAFAIFSDGKNRNWPELYLECAYYEEGRFYYITLMCEFSPSVNYERKRSNK